MPTNGSKTMRPLHLVVWGDHTEAPGSHWTGSRRQAGSYVESVSNLGHVTTLDLPTEGILGNSHFLMMDANGDVVFTHLVNWLDRH